MFRPLNLLFIFALIYCFDLASLNRYLAHPEYLNYYPSFRYWFLTEILQGHFPQWNPYWGLGHSTEIASTFPIDIFSPLELLFGPRYHLFQPLQCFAILSAAFYSFKSFGVPIYLAAASAILFFLSPWVNYFFFYYLKPPTFITLLLSTSLAYQWFRTRIPSTLYKYTLVLILGFFGMKLEYLFFLCVFLSLFSLLYYLIHRNTENPISLTCAGYSLLAIVFALVCHTWQFVPLLQILKEANRLESPQGLSAFAHAELYEKLLLSFQILFSDIASPEGWKHLFGPFGVGAVTSLLVLYFKVPLKAREALKRIFIFIPLAYYWCRQEPGDIRELTVLHSAPALLTFLFGFFYFMAGHAIAKNKLAQVLFALFLCLIVARDQGQIILSYTTGALWIPTRDNFLFDFLLISMASIGLGTLPLKSPRQSAFILAGLALFSIGNNLYYVHPLIKKNDGKFPEYTGRKSYNLLYSELLDSQNNRAFLFDLKASLDLPFFGTSLWKKQNSIQLMSSLGSKRYRDWILFQRYGIRPESHWAGYENEYTEKTIRKLPLRNNYGYENTVIYWNTLHAFPPPNPNTLRILGVTHLYYEGPRVLLPGLTDYKTIQSFETAKLQGSLPRAFSVMLNKSLQPAFSTEMNPVIHSNTIEMNEMNIPYEQILISNFQNEKITLHTQFNEERLLVLSELFHPFWRAQIDGLESKISPALYLYRSINVGKGPHKIEFYCAIPYLRLGFSISLILILSFFITPLALYGRRKKAQLVKIYQTKLGPDFGG